VDDHIFEELDFVGSFSYDEKEDALRVSVKPHAAEAFEVLTYVFDDVKPDSALATLRWEKLAVPFRVSVDVKAVVLKSVKTNCGASADSPGADTTRRRSGAGQQLRTGASAEVGRHLDPE